MSHKNFFLLLSILFCLYFLILGIAPYDRADWLLENVLVFILAGVLFLSFQSFPLSRVSYTLIFLFLCLHEIGAHYTYAKVPYDTFLSQHFNFSLNDLMGWERNHFDRLVHFVYGLFLAYPIRELYCRIADVKGFWSYFFPLDLTMASSMLFELIEWGVAEAAGGELGMAYLGTQGDIWDAHKDMALASLGALIAMLITLCINVWLQKRFSEEWEYSLRVKHNEPLGEDEIERMRNNE